MLLAKCKCNRYQSRIEWPLVRFRCWYNCPCMSYYLLYRWCILLSQINFPLSRQGPTDDHGRDVHGCHIFICMKKHKIFWKNELAVCENSKWFGQLNFYTWDFFENSMNFNLSAFPNFLNISSCFKYVSHTSLFFGSSITFSRFESWPLANRNSWKDGQTSYHLEPVLEPAGTWIPTHHNDTE